MQAAGGVGELSLWPKVGGWWYTLIESCNSIMRLMAEFRHI